MDKYTQTDILNSLTELKKAIDFLSDCCVEKNAKTSQLSQENQNLTSANANLLSAKAELINKYEKAKPLISAASTKISDIITILQKEV